MCKLIYDSKKVCFKHCLQKEKAFYTKFPGAH